MRSCSNEERERERERRGCGGELVTFLVSRTFSSRSRAVGDGGDDGDSDGDGGSI